MDAEKCPDCDAKLPPEARFCAYCGLTVDVGVARLRPREERRVITALFADLAGSTQLGECLDPEEFRELTGGALARMGAAIEGLGGTVRGSAGDGVLGLFGAPIAHEDDAERAVLAGLRLVNGMRGYAKEAADRWGVPELRVRVGIETGLAVLGEVRAGSQIQYDASGDCLNTAARLEGAADVNGVLVGPLTHRVVAEAFEWGEPRPLDLKGKARPVLARHARSSRGDAPQRGLGAGAGSRLLGRSREIAHAEKVVVEVRAGTFRTVFVTGQAGIGKTRFTQELQSLFLASRSGSSTPVWLDGTCRSYDSDEPYLPFRQVLRQALGGVDSAAEVRKRVTTLIGSHRAAGVAPILGLILGLTSERDDKLHAAALSAESVRQAVIEAFAELLIGLAERGAVAVALDDMHWADAASLRLAEGLIARMPENAPVLLLLAMRSDRDREAWALREQTLRGDARRTRDFSLDSLDREAERELVSHLVGHETLPKELESVVLQRAEGNPFYLGELLRSLRDTGALVQAGGEWRFDRDVPVELPETVERVVLARIDRLSAGDRDLLNSAAVIGREFDVPLLDRIATADASPSSLANLTRLRLIEQIPEQKYRFCHPLIQEAAYESMLRRGRAKLHSVAAAAIEELAAPDSDEHHATLARHHRAAGNVAAAVKYHRLAAIAAQRMVAPEEALDQLDHAITAATSLDADSTRGQLPELYLLRGRARGRNGDFDGGADDFRQALATAHEIGDGQIEMQALNDLGWLIRAHGYEEAIALHQQALRRAEELDDPSTQVTALSRMSMVNLNRLRLDHGLELAQRSVEIARATGQDELLGAALDALKFGALQVGDLDLLDRTVAEIVEVHERTGDLYLTQWAYIELATVPLARGELDRADELINRAIEINSRIGADRITRSMILEARSWIDCARGDLDAAVSGLREAVETFSELNIPEFSAWVEASLGSQLIEQGSAHEAIGVLESALRNAEAAKSPNRILRAASHLAWAHWQVGDVSASRRAQVVAEQVLGTITAPPGSVFLDGYRSYLAIARTRHASGDPRGADALLVPLCVAARQQGWHDAEAAASDLLGVLPADRQANQSR